mgnify:FL=1
MAKTSEQKREQEKYVVAEMIRIYCKGNHKIHKPLCPSCIELLKYCEARVNRCPMMETKTFCSACKVHCYKPQMREEIKKVMRYAGPKMITVHPILAIKHMIIMLKKRN